MSVQDSPLSLGTDSLAKLLFRYAMPAIIAQIAASLYNIVDSIFVGQGVGPLAITGLALTMPMMNLTAAFGAMVGAGSAALTSIRLGQGNKPAAENILGNVVLLNVVLGVLLMFFGLFYLDELLYFFGASEQTIPYAREYMRIILYGNVITHMFHGLNCMLRVAGYPNKAMNITFISVILNAILDAVFILWLKWGIAGSAWATVISQLVALAVQTVHFSRRLTEDRRLRVKMQRIVCKLTLVQSNRQSNAKSITVFERDRALNARDVRRDADVIIRGLHRTLQHLQNFNAIAAEADLCLVVRDKLIARARTADGV
jgi:putative MATE family efflux protein